MYGAGAPKFAKHMLSDEHHLLMQNLQKLAERDKKREIKMQN